MTPLTSSHPFEILLICWISREYFVSLETKGCNWVYPWLVVKPFCFSTDDFRVWKFPHLNEPETQARTKHVHSLIYCIFKLMSKRFICNSRNLVSFKEWMPRLRPTIWIFYYLEKSSIFVKMADMTTNSIAIIERELWLGIDTVDVYYMNAKEYIMNTQHKDTTKWHYVKTTPIKSHVF